MMELKVWVEGIQRIVCGVTVNTTCQDVVFALAHATGKVGRFTLIERWRNNERLLAPNENPLKLLLKWGEYANDVQFILQRSENKLQQQQQQQRPTNNNTNNNSSSNKIDCRNQQVNAATMLKKPLGISNNDSAINAQNQQKQQQSRSVDLNTKTTNQKPMEFKKSFGAYESKQSENIGIVKGVPQRSNVVNAQQRTTPNVEQPFDTYATVVNNTPQKQNSPLLHSRIPRHEKSHSNPIEMPANQAHLVSSPHQLVTNLNESNNNNIGCNNIYQQIGAQNSKSINEINLAVVRNSLECRMTSNESPEIMFKNNNNNNNNNNNSISSNENLLDIYNGNSKFNASPDLYKNSPTISANGALVPPPYRDPPPPRNSPLQLQQQRMQTDIATPPYGNGTNPFMNDYNNDYDFEMSHSNSAVVGEESESIFQASQYNDLMQLIKFQREKISAQQVELTKYDAEIVFLENKERDQAQELEAISREITKADQIFRQGSEQLQTLQYVEEENELVKQQEKTLKSEIALLRSKLANCESELLQCKNKIRILMDEIELEQRAISNKQKTNRQNIERDFLMEMERIQSEIDQAIQSTETSNKTAENLKKEILLIENAISEKKRQVEKLVNEMKEVNLQSLTVTTSEEIKSLLEGSNKAGSSRRIIGSPRQLENAVPTSKNPHGVWV